MYTHLTNIYTHIHIYIYLELNPSEAGKAKTSEFAERVFDLKVTTNIQVLKFNCQSLQL